MRRCHLISVDVGSSGDGFLLKNDSILHWDIKKFIHRVIPSDDIVISSWITLDNLMIVLEGLHLVWVVSEEGLYGVTLNVDGCVVDG